MDLRNRVCNLCLVKCENFKSIKGNRKIDLGILLPTIEFTAIQEPVVCEKCEEVLKKCINFKTTCLQSYDCIVSLVNNRDAVKLDIKDIYLSKNVTNAGVSEDQGLCGLCLNLVENSHAISLDVEVAEEGNVILEKMIERCLPELDLSIFKNPIMCADCHRSLENCFRFVTDCLTAEEKIKEYCGSLNVCSDKIELSGLLHSTVGTVKASDISGDAVDVIKAEKQFCVKIENPNESTIGGAGDVIKLEQISCTDSEYINDIGNKNEILMTSDKQKVNNEQQFTPKSMFACVEGNMLGTVKIEETVWEENETKPECGDFVETDDQKFILSEEIEVKSEEIGVKTDEHDLNSAEKCIRTQTRINGRLSRRRKCLISHCENHLLKPHLKQKLMKKDARNITNQHECGLLQTKNTQCIKTPELFYKASTEVARFKCDSCPYQTNHKYSLKNHLLKHMDPSEIPMFSCDLCLFRTKYKKCLRQHAVTHKASSEIITSFKCYSCPFQTRLKHSLKSHMLKHMDPSKVTLLNCDFCPHQTKYKYALKQHLISYHKTSSEVTMFKCDFCSYQTKFKRSLKQHSITHKTSSEVIMFKCDSCSYQTKDKKCLQRHFVIHKASSEVTMFKCDSCPFQSRWKSAYKTHMLKHIKSNNV